MVERVESPIPGEEQRAPESEDPRDPPRTFDSETTHADTNLDGCPLIRSVPLDLRESGKSRYGSTVVCLESFAWTDYISPRLRTLGGRIYNLYLTYVPPSHPSHPSHEDQLCIGLDKELASHLPRSIGGLVTH